MVSFNNKDKASSITIFSDADWGGNLDDKTSTNGCVVYLRGNPIVWKSSKKKTVARSSIEAEYRSLANATTEISWLKNFLKDLHVQISNTLVPLCDNIEPRT